MATSNLFAANGVRDVDSKMPETKLYRAKHSHENDSVSRFHRTAAALISFIFSCRWSGRRHGVYNWRWLASRSYSLPSIKYHWHSMVVFILFSLRTMYKSLPFDWQKTPWTRPFYYALSTLVPLVDVYSSLLLLLKMFWISFSIFRFCIHSPLCCGCTLHSEYRHTHECVHVE